MLSSEQFAEQLVTLFQDGPGGCYGIRLSAPGIEPVVVGRTPNPAVAREWITATRSVVAAALDAGRAQPELAEVPRECLTSLVAPPTSAGGGRLVVLPD